MLDNIRKLFKLKSYVYGHLNFLKKLKAYNPRSIYIALLLGTLTLLFEGLGVSILVPLLSYIQVDGDIEKFKSSSLLSLYLYNFLNFLGLKINMLLLSLIAIVFILFRQILNFLHLIIIQKISTHIHKKVNLEMFNCLMKSSYKFMSSLNTGKFINATDIEPSMIAMTMKSYFTFYNNILTMIVYMTVLFMTAFIPTLLGVLFLILVVFISGSKHTIRTKKLGENLVNLRSKYRDLITERFLGWKTIKTFDTVDIEAERLSEVQKEFYNDTVNITKVTATAQLVYVSISTTIILLILNVLIVKLSFDAAKIVIFGAAFMRLTPTFKVFQHNIIRLVELLPSYIFCEKIYENAKKFSIKDKGSIDKLDLNNEIKFQKVYFNYKAGQRDVLTNLSFSIKFGKINAITGPSGSGKSTIVGLVSKVLIASKGKIFFDNYDINKIKEKYLRKLITYIPQDPFLFSDSILNNIQYGSEKNSKKNIWDALELVKMDKFIKELPEKLNTNVGLLGNSLSGGQRQRLILARAILRKSEILILDEATSAVDIKTDDLIQRSLKNIVKKKNKITIILISHRVLSFMNADHIISINNGKVEYEGKPKNFKRGIA